MDADLLDATTLAGSDLGHHRGVCDFLGSVLSTSMARSAVSADEQASDPHVRIDTYQDLQFQLQHYKDSRMYAHSFRHHLPTPQHTSVSDQGDSAYGRACTLLAFEFEATVRMKEWDTAFELVRVKTYSFHL